MHSPSTQPHGGSANSAAIRNVFVRRVHQLVQLGFERLTPAEYAQAQEPDITGDLAQAIDHVLSERVKPWMDKFSVHDDPPVHDGRRKGKRRKRVDLRIDFADSPRARFRFESKRLGKHHRVSVYLGPEGLGCFLRGDYARNENEAGMLGYIQSGDAVDWANQLSMALVKSFGDYEVDAHDPFVPSPAGISALPSYCSKHERKAVGVPIVLYHTLLKFH